jgi:WhiB family redox-sensing transcriptional regulator
MAEYESAAAMPLAAIGGDEKPNWRDRALCVEVDPELWFPELGANSPAAKVICARCEVRAQCLAFAVAGNEQYGIWGGLSPMQRRPLHRGNRPTEAVRMAEVA